MRLDLHATPTLLVTALLGLATLRHRNVEIITEKRLHIQHAAATPGIPLQPQLNQCDRESWQTRLRRWSEVLRHELGQGIILGAVAEAALVASPTRQVGVLWPQDSRNGREELCNRH